MPLSEHEQRLLEQIERALVDDDPKFASTVRTGDRRLKARRKLQLGAVLVVVGLAVLVGGAVAQSFLVGALGSLVELRRRRPRRPELQDRHRRGRDRQQRPRHRPRPGDRGQVRPRRPGGPPAAEEPSRGALPPPLRPVAGDRTEPPGRRSDRAGTSRQPRPAPQPPPDRLAQPARPRRSTSEAGHSRARSRTSRAADRSSPCRAVRSAVTSSGSVPFAAGPPVAGRLLRPGQPRDRVRRPAVAVPAAPPPLRPAPAPHAAASRPAAAARPRRGRWPPARPTARRSSRPRAGAGAAEPGRAAGASGDQQHEHQAPPRRATATTSRRCPARRLAVAAASPARSCRVVGAAAVGADGDGGGLPDVGAGVGVGTGRPGQVDRPLRRDRRGVERHPAEALEVDLDPGVRVVGGDQPAAVALLLARGVAEGHPGRHAGRPHQHRHRPGVLLAVAAAQPEEVDQVVAAGAGRGGQAVD